MINAVSLVGRLTKDIEMRVSQSGTEVASFTLAVNRRFKKDGENEADFIRCIAFGKTAQVMAQYTHKGSLIGIEGRIQTGSYEKDGQRIYTTDVIVSNMSMLESKNAQQGGSQGAQRTENPFGNVDFTQQQKAQQAQNTGTYGSSNGGQSYQQNNQGYQQNSQGYQQNSQSYQQQQAQRGQNQDVYGGLDINDSDLPF